LPAESWTRTLSTTTSIAREIATVVYDAKPNPVRSYATNYLEGYTDTTLELVGVPRHTITYNKRTSTSRELNITDAFTYSQQSRLLTDIHQIVTATAKFWLQRNMIN
jgi:hypothetical protein